MTENSGKWERLKSEVILESPWMNVLRNAYRFPDGGTVDDFYIVERRDYAVIFAVAEDGRTPLVRQYRAGVNEFTLELPSGFMDAGESPEAAARRELEEETGLIVDGPLERVTTFLVEPSNMPWRAHVFLARSVKDGGRRIVTSQENQECYFPTQEELRELLRDPETHRMAMPTVASCYAALEKLHRREE